MKNSVKLFLTGVALTGLAFASVAQADNRDVVRDSRGEKVCTIAGNCVRSMWLNSIDECPKTISEAFAVFFDFGRASINKAGKKELDALAANLKMKGDALLGVRVIGYADKIGNPAKNEKLSKRRADAVRDYLISRGVVNAKVLETRWFGDSVTRTFCPSNVKKSVYVQCLQPDRRVEIEVDFSVE